ncbi:ATP-dependent nuclease [Cupriavidus sp. M-11]|uniref:ATP-dependent nuclease n=1 Tax=Cupriavidus sp. M-11 TaxID=3233038 RepID=UPI003F911657
MPENTVGVSIESLSFSGGQAVRFGKNDVIIIVGPNNAGKSATLREMVGRLQSVGGIPAAYVLTDITVGKPADEQSVWDFVRQVGKPMPGTPPDHYFRAGQGANPYTVTEFFRNPGFSGLFNWFVVYIDASTRLSLAQAQQSIDFGAQQPNHPMHYLHQDNAAMGKLARWFKRAFGTEIAVDHFAGQTIPLHVGPNVVPQEGENVMNDDYRQRLRNAPRLDVQGDGMRGFVGVLMHVLLGHQAISLVDEPEAFLHPPQARQLGKRIAEEHADGQVFIATHSADFLRGALEAKDRPLRVLRLRRVADKNHVSELTPDKIREVWGDPALRYSNILDGAFHEKVVICEAEGDCRFYGAIADALRDEDEHPYARDMMFVQSGGKGGISKLVRALKSLDVPVAAVVDFDVLCTPAQLWPIVEALGGVKDTFEVDYRAVKASIDALGKTTPEAFRDKALAVLGGIDVGQDEVPRKILSEMQKVLKVSVGNARAKESGIGVLSRDAKPAGQRLLDALAGLGLFVVPNGELESFVVEESEEKNAWVAAVLEKHGNNLKAAPELAEARQFVSRFIRV